MATVLDSAADVVNAALVRIGYKKGDLGTLYDGSEAAAAALAIYGQTRDEMLRDGNWDFAKRTVAMTVLKFAPVDGYFAAPWDGATNPPPPWLFEYAYPADCLKVRSVNQAPLFVLQFDPQPFVFQVSNDSYFTPPRKVILTNVPNAFLTYAGQVTNPSTWEVSFTESLITALGRRLAPRLMDLQTAQAAAQDEKVQAGIANATQG